MSKKRLNSDGLAEEMDIQLGLPSPEAARIELEDAGRKVAFIKRRDS